MKNARIRGSWQSMRTKCIHNRGHFLALHSKSKCNSSLWSYKVPILWVSANVRNGRKRCTSLRKPRGRIIARSTQANGRDSPPAQEGAAGEASCVTTAKACPQPIPQLNCTGRREPAMKSFQKLYFFFLKTFLSKIVSISKECERKAQFVRSWLPFYKRNRCFIVIKAHPFLYKVTLGAHIYSK